MTDVTEKFCKVISGTLSDGFFFYSIVIMELYSIGGLLSQKGFTDE
jgi:hypothetical protein